MLAKHARKSSLPRRTGLQPLQSLLASHVRRPHIRGLQTLHSTRNAARPQHRVPQHLLARLPFRPHPRLVGGWRWRSVLASTAPAFGLPAGPPGPSRSPPRRLQHHLTPRLLAAAPPATTVAAAAAAAAAVLDCSSGSCCERQDCRRGDWWAAGDRWGCRLGLGMERRTGLRLGPVAVEGPVLHSYFPTSRLLQLLRLLRCLPGGLL